MVYVATLNCLLRSGLAVRCSKAVRLRGGFVVEVRRARKQYACFYCRRPVAVGAFYVSIRGFRVGSVERYHVECFNRVMPHRLVVLAVAGELRICRALEDESIL